MSRELVKWKKIAKSQDGDVKMLSIAILTLNKGHVLLYFINL